MKWESVLLGQGALFTHKIFSFSMRRPAYGNKRLLDKFAGGGGKIK